MRALQSAVLALVVALIAAPAAALSCLEPDVRATFWRYSDRPETWLPAVGTFSDLRKLRHDRAKDRVLWTARFAGHSASSRGWDQPMDAEVTIVVPLFSGIAGGETDPDALARWLPGQTGLVWLERTPRGYAAVHELCEPFLDTDKANWKRALDCLRGRRCARPGG
ncbi:MAG: hypothetical protein KF887_12765 [Paracoccaceae bacterium]|nr:MAG: hypothetical protein KF887_12765 [Paracoccaceae bacterium]